MPDWAGELLGYGPLGLFAIAACWMFWQVSKKFVTWGERYVGSAEKLHETLREADKIQRHLCKTHSEALEQLVGVMKVTLGKDVVRDEKIDIILTEQKQQATIGSTGVAMLSIERLRLAALEACELCRCMHTPNASDTAKLVARHCEEIKRILDHSS